MKPAAVAALACAVALSGCAFVKGAQQGFDKSFRTSFKKSFVSSCAQNPALTAAYCGCAADDIESRYSDDRLMKMSANESGEMRAALEHAQEACKSKLGR